MKNFFISIILLLFCYNPIINSTFLLKKNYFIKISLWEKIKNFFSNKKNNPQNVFFLSVKFIDSFFQSVQNEEKYNESYSHEITYSHKITYSDDPDIKKYEQNFIKYYLLSKLIQSQNTFLLQNTFFLKSIKQNTFLKSINFNEVQVYLSDTSEYYDYLFNIIDQNTFHVLQVAGKDDLKMGGYQDQAVRKNIEQLHYPEKSINKRYKILCNEIKSKYTYKEINKKINDTIILVHINPQNKSKMLENIAYVVNYALDASSIKNITQIIIM